MYRCICRPQQRIPDDLNCSHISYKQQQQRQPRLMTKSVNYYNLWAGHTPNTTHAHSHSHTLKLILSHAHSHALLFIGLDKTFNGTKNLSRNCNWCGPIKNVKMFGNLNKCSAQLIDITIVIIAVVVVVIFVSCHDKL